MGTCPKPPFQLRPGSHLRGKPWKVGERKRLKVQIVRNLWVNSTGVIGLSPSRLLLSGADRRSGRMWGGCRTE